MDTLNQGKEDKNKDIIENNNKNMLMVQRGYLLCSL